MKLIGHAVGTIEKITTVTLREEPDVIALRFRALPPTYADDAEGVLPSPDPPRVGPLRGKGGIIERDGAGRPIIEYNELDAKYVSDTRNVNELQGIKMIVDAALPDQFAFSAELNGAGDHVLYYETIRTELAEFGFNLGDVMRMIRAIRQVSGISDADMKAGLEGFTEAEG